MDLITYCLRQKHENQLACQFLDIIHKLNAIEILIFNTHILQIIINTIVTQIIIRTDTIAATFEPLPGKNIMRKLKQDLHIFR